MVEAEEAGAGRPIRRWRTLSEKRRIAELTLEPGASVAVVARANGVNANQVFKWRRMLQRGRTERACDCTDISSSSYVVSSERHGRWRRFRRSEGAAGARRLDSHRVSRQGHDQCGEWS